jgi:hypothetical protein
MAHQKSTRRKRTNSSSMMTRRQRPLKKYKNAKSHLCPLEGDDAFDEEEAAKTKYTDNDDLI